MSEKQKWVAYKHRGEPGSSPSSQSFGTIRVIESELFVEKADIVEFEIPGLITSWSQSTADLELYLKYVLVMVNRRYKWLYSHLSFIWEDETREKWGVRSKVMYYIKSLEMVIKCKSYHFEHKSHITLTKCGIRFCHVNAHNDSPVCSRQQQDPAPLGKL